MRRGFTLIEVLVCVAMIALLMGLLLPGLAWARSGARAIKCQAQLRQLHTAWSLYAGDFADRAMPLAYWSAEDIGDGPEVYWWGGRSGRESPLEFERGFLGAYAAVSLGERSALECPEARWGSYSPQGPDRRPTTTYGYNGYFLSPSKTPGWAESIGHRPWRRVSEVARPSALLVFADAMLEVSAGRARNTGLLDPPMLFDGSGSWNLNRTPTTCFRHGAGRSTPGAACGVRADGSTAKNPGKTDEMVGFTFWTGSLGISNEPWYVPDWLEW